MDGYYNLARLIIRICQIIFWQNCKASGSLSIPAGGKIIAGNHPNATDGLFLPFVFHEKLHFFVQGDIFNYPFIGWLLGKSGQIRVIPGQKQLAMEHGIRLVRQGKTVVIFPEARLNPEYQSIKAYTGAIRLSLMGQAPIIPIGFYVQRRNLHHFNWQRTDRLSQGDWQYRGLCFLHVGSPWSPAEECGGSVDAALLHELTNHLMDKIATEASLAQQDCLQG